MPHFMIIIAEIIQNDNEFHARLITSHYVLLPVVHAHPINELIFTGLYFRVHSI